MLQSRALVKWIVGGSIAILGGDIAFYSFFVPVKSVPFPADVLALQSIPKDSFVDCYKMDIDGSKIQCSGTEGIEKFVRSYLKGPMTLERRLLQLVKGFPARTNEEINAMKLIPGDQISAFQVLARGEEDILLGVGNFRTWLKVECKEGKQICYFGSVVITESQSEKRVVRFAAPFHKLYSRFLLYHTTRRFLKENSSQ